MVLAFARRLFLSRRLQLHQHAKRPNGPSLLHYRATNSAGFGMLEKANEDYCNAASDMNGRVLRSVVVVIALYSG